HQPEPVLQGRAVAPAHVVAALRVARRDGSSAVPPTTGRSLVVHDWRARAGAGAGNGGAVTALLSAAGPEGEGGNLRPPGRAGVHPGGRNRPLPSRAPASEAAAAGRHLAGQA